MFKLCIFAALLAFAVAEPKAKPGLVAPLVAEAPIAYTAGYAAPLAYSAYSGHYATEPLAYSAPLTYAHGGHFAYSAPYATYFK